MKINNINTNTSIYGLYNSMYQGSMSLNSIKMNKSMFSPNNAKGMQQLGEGAMQYVKNIKSASKDLSSSLKELSGAAFNKKTAISSDNDVMSVKYTGNKASDIKQTTVNVDQTAAGQVNEGSRMNANAAFGDSGVNKFSININGKENEISVNIAAGESNSSVQQKMADAINNAGIGVKATVEADSSSGVSMLKLESTGTGDNASGKFSITDITGNLSEKTGANQVSVEARNAIYRVNGGAAKTSESNNVDIGGGLNVTFNKASDRAITISAGKDSNSAKVAVESFVKSYNDLYIEAAQRASDPKSQNLASKMIGVSKTYSGSLSSIGIGFDNDGKMTLDTAKLNAASENGSLEKFFTENAGKNYGFTNQLARLSDNVSRNTSNFVSRSEFGSSLTENFAYSSYGDLVQYNYLSAGWIFDYST